MRESRRLAYLEAMGYEVWAAKPAARALNRLQMTPGQGGTLLVCDSAEASSTRLAGDFGRALGGDPVWAWPDPDGSGDCPTLQEAVERLDLERIIVFGYGLGQHLLRGDVPEVLGSAVVLVTAGLNELAVSGPGKREIWKKISQKISP